MNEQALKERLKQLAKNKKKSFQEVWKLLLLERFLVRLSHSNYFSKFIFKGGLLLSYYLEIARETTDIDFLAQHLHAGLEPLKNVLSEICGIEENDGFIISLQNIEELDHTHMNYLGYRAKLNVRFGNMKDRIQIDIGVGDIVDPKEISWELYRHKEQPFFESTISLQAYPIETIFSEKFQTIISRGAANSRMKDFHDILLLSRKDTLIDTKKIKENINTTFQHRNTEITIPIKFTEDESFRLQSLWATHLRTLGNEIKKELNFPDAITDLLREVNDFLVKL